MRDLRRIAVLAVGIALGLALFAGGATAVDRYQDHRATIAAERAAREQARQGQAAQAQEAADQAAADQQEADAAAAAQQWSEQNDANWRADGRRAAAADERTRRALVARADAETRHAEACSRGEATDC